MKPQNLLTGRWEFIATERYCDYKWIACKEYVVGMVWSFEPEFFSSTKVVGRIIETTPHTETINLQYLFDTARETLKMEIYTDPIAEESRTNPQSDLYELTTDEERVATIKLSILNQWGCPPPYFRYTLQRL